MAFHLVHLELVTNTNVFALYLVPIDEMEPGKRYGWTEFQKNFERYALTAEEYKKIATMASTKARINVKFLWIVDDFIVSSSSVPSSSSTQKEQ